MTSLHRAWAALPRRLRILEPLPFSADDWSLVERLHEKFNDRDAHGRLPLSIARFREEARKAIHEQAKHFEGVRTVSFSDRSFLAGDAAGSIEHYARLYNEDVDEMMGVLVPSARYHKRHYAYGRFTVPTPHGLHTDHSAEDPQSAGEPICIARIETLGTHYLAGDYEAHSPRIQSMLKALRYWVAAPEGEPDGILEELLRQGTLKTIPVNHVMLMVAGNASEETQVTQHIAARPPAGGLHSAFFQRQYRLK